MFNKKFHHQAYQNLTFYKISQGVKKLKFLQNITNQVYRNNFSVAESLVVILIWDYFIISKSTILCKIWTLKVNSTFIILNFKQLLTVCVCGKWQNSCLWSSEILFIFTPCKYLINIWQVWPGWFTDFRIYTLG